MKQLHRKDLFGWSHFDEERNLDFHSVLWVRDQGNVIIDPLPMSNHDQRHLETLGGAKIIVISNSDHCRDAKRIAKSTGAILLGPVCEKANFPFTCDRWIQDQDEIVPGLVAYQLEGSKTPGELALILEKTTLITGDLIRCHRGGELCLLPDAKLTDKSRAIQSVKRLASLGSISTVLSGDGWPIFNAGVDPLRALANSL
jgi:Metallo-beta-lactamase superfamily